MNKSPLRLGAILSLCGMMGAGADVAMPGLFSEHMVLMKSQAVPIWGNADPGEAVKVTLNGHRAKAIADANGKWKVSLNLEDCGAGPFAMTVAGKNTIVISDVAVGQVWITGGQSNMQLPLKVTMNGTDEAAKSANPKIRVYRVPQKGTATPQDDCGGSWIVAGPETSGNYSAIGYYFAKAISAQVGQPVGIIDTSWGGTMIEMWCSQQVLDEEPAFKAGDEARRKAIADFRPLHQAWVKDFGDWLKATQREDKRCPDPAAYAGDDVSTADWTPVNLPGPVSGLPANGALWFRREIDLPQDQLNETIKPAIGELTGFATVYWNGKQVFDVRYPQYPGAGSRIYFQVPPEDLRAGKNVIAIRYDAPGLPAAFLQAPATFIAGPLKLAGPWQAKAEYALPPLTADQRAAMPKAPPMPPLGTASGIFNGVVNPLIPYGIAGILWYQGESNTAYAWQYRTLFPLFIQDLRAKWHQPTLPFYFCQLANDLPKQTNPGRSEWAELREAQSLALKLPDTAQAVLIDLGESDNVHYRNKKAAADRLVKIALARQYGQKKLAYSGPVYQSMAIEGDKIRLKFTHAEGGLAARPLPPTYDVSTLIGKTAPLVPNSPGSQLEGFAICGADHRFVWADARIDGDSVVVSSAKVPQPVAVRYGWAENPTCNLTNGADLPASPFRTDDFPAMTQPNRYGLPKAAMTP